MPMSRPMCCSTTAAANRRWSNTIWPSTTLHRDASDGPGGRGAAAVSGLGRTVQQADLVAVRIAQIGQVHGALAFAAPAGRVFAGHAPRCNAGSVGGIGLFNGFGGKAKGAAVADGRGLALDGLGHAERAARMAPEQAVAVQYPGLGAQRAQQGVVE